MSYEQKPIIAAGHICLDIIPRLDGHGSDLAALLAPGTLLEVGAAVVSTGGPVSNTGLALHRLGLPTRVMGKVGDDLFGDAIIKLVRRDGEDLARGMIVTPGEHTSYTVVISPPGIDRVFLHCPGANDTFGAADVPAAQLDAASVFHFGYPPLMRRMYAEGGAELERLLRQAKARGVVTSVDMCLPDPRGPSGQVRWDAILARVLPYVDLFLPSIEETLYMLDRPRFEALAATGDLHTRLDGALLGDVAGRLLDLGAGVVALKLGDRGLYVRTSTNAGRLAELRPLVGDALAMWVGRELWVPCFAVEVVGTTGCGDATIAGFLAGLWHGLPLERTLIAAVAVGACNVEQADSISGVTPWEDVQRRIAAGWTQRAWTAPQAGWCWDGIARLARGPHDRGAAAPV